MSESKITTEIEVLTSLKKQLVEFLDELIELFPGEEDFIVARILVNDQLPIMEYFITNLCPLQEQVKNRNEEFFLKNNLLFDHLNSDKINTVNHFKQIWTSGQLDKQDKETIWRWFASFIAIGNKYKKLIGR